MESPPTLTTLDVFVPESSPLGARGSRAARPPPPGRRPYRSVKILDRLPYVSDPTFVRAPGEGVRVKPYQIVVYVSVSLQALVEWDPRTPSFPAILDTGNNHNLSIRKGQLRQWAGLQPEALPIIGVIRERAQRIPLHFASAWLHRNLPGQRALKDREPHPLKLEEGIAIYPDDVGPRLPILGLRALTQNQLSTAIDSERTRLDLRTPDWATTVLRLVGRFL